MANPNKVALGQAFVDRLLQHVPEDQRETVRTAITTEPALEEIGGGVLRQEDYSRTREKQVAWQRTQENKLSAFDRLVQAGKITEADLAPGTVVPPQQQPQQVTDPNKLPLSREEFNEQARVYERQMALMQGRINRIGMEHYKEFGEVLDTEAMLAAVLEKGVPVLDYYAQSVAERRTTAAKAKYDADILAAETRGKQAGLAEAMKSGSAPPYPVGAGAPTTLAGLRATAEQKSEHTLDAAVATLIAETNKSQATA